MNDNTRRGANIVQQAIDMRLTLSEIEALLRKRPQHYAPLRQILETATIMRLVKEEEEDAIL